MGTAHDNATDEEIRANAPAHRSWEMRNLALGRTKAGEFVTADVRLNYERNGPKPVGVPELGISFAVTEAAPKGKHYKHGGPHTSYGQVSGLEFEAGSFGAAIVFLWKGYHLNNTHAGCEHQRAAGWESDMEPSDYGQRLAHVGNPCPICGYKFGTEWRTVDLPADVVSWLEEFHAKRVAEGEAIRAELGL